MLTESKLTNRAILVESIVGSDPLNSTRKRDVVTARALLVWSLFMDGHTEHEVAEAMGWHRTSVHHYRDIFKDALMYHNRPELIMAWDELKKVLN